MTMLRMLFDRGRLGALVVPFALAACSAWPGAGREVRQAIWVTRFDYRTEADVREIVRNCARAGFDTVFFQVRGNGTVFYRSRIEPWAEQFGWRDPGFDPLRVACDEAYRQGVRLHAWVNAVPGWRGNRPPEHPRQLYNAHPEWFLVDRNGERQPLVDDYYVALNPCLPEVRAYIAGICAEIAGRYPVAGVHLDYIRFLEKKEGHDYPYDARTLALYREATGLTPAQDPDRWARWKTDQVSALVLAIRRAVRAANGRATLSAAVFAPPDRALTVHQDWVRWLRRGWIDFAVPMVYDSDDARFNRRLDAIRAEVGDRPVVVGIGVFKHRDPEQTLRQIAWVRALGFQGFSLFSYASFYRTRAQARDEEPGAAELRKLRRDRILPKIRAGLLGRTRP